MTLDKAIEILRLDNSREFEGHEADLQQAKRMGLEALERIRDMRGYKTLMAVAVSEPGRLLPSEAIQ